MTREDIETALADAHRARGFALMHGKKYDSRIIEDLHEQLAAYQDLDTAKAAARQQHSSTAPRLLTSATK
jgi:hypothetical protein